MNLTQTAANMHSFKDPLCMKKCKLKCKFRIIHSSLTWKWTLFWTIFGWSNVITLSLTVFIILVALLALLTEPKGSFDEFLRTDLSSFMHCLSGFDLLFVSFWTGTSKVSFWTAKMSKDSFVSRVYFLIGVAYFIFLI